MIITLSDSAFPNIEALNNISWGFRTSADVMMEASGLRIEAIRAIAREQGIKIDETNSRCIDENLLSLLADAHVRRLKFYFNNSKRHLAELSGAELSTFIDFCNTFKKHQITKNAALSWDIIDTDAIREQFIRKVHSLTPGPDLPLFAQGIKIQEITFESLSQKLDNHDAQINIQRQDAVIERVLVSRWLYLRPVVKTEHTNDKRLLVMQVTLPSRYHIFPDEDPEQLLYGTSVFIIIQRAPRKVA